MIKDMRSELRSPQQPDPIDMLPELRSPQEPDPIRVRVSGEESGLCLEVRNMKKSRFTEEQIALRQAEAGTPIVGVCRRMGYCADAFHLKHRTKSHLLPFLPGELYACL